MWRHQLRHNDVIVFERDSRYFTNARKLTMETGSSKLSSHEQIERLFRLKINP